MDEGYVEIGRQIWDHGRMESKLARDSELHRKESYTFGASTVAIPCFVFGAVCFDAVAV